MNNFLNMYSFKKRNPSPFISTLSYIRKIQLFFNEEKNLQAHIMKYEESWD